MINMAISDRGISLLEVLEDFRSNPYLCSGNKRTVGYGHVIRSKEHFTFPISKETARELLRKDLERFERAVNKGVNSDIALEQHQYDALVSFAFNIGVYAFLNEATALDCINEGRHIAALDWMRKWNKARDENGYKREVFGLVVRREMEVKMYSGQMEKVRTGDFDLIKEKTRKELLKERN